jgi:ParB family transcriptional regulator, chromosome partitioning protein
MAGVKNDLLANVAASMRDSVPVHGETPLGQPPSLVRQHEGRKRLESACVIKLDRIAADANQPRTEFDPEALGRLAESLKARGQLQPIRVRWDDDASRYVVVVGERRWRAAKLAGLESLACVVVTGNPTPEELLEDQLIENCLREDLKPIEQARAYRALLDGQGVSLRVLAERLNVGHASIARALALLDLPAEIQAEVEAGRIAPATGYQLVKVADPVEQAELAREAARGRLTRDVAERAGKPRKGRGPAKGRKATSRVFRGTTGKVTVELRKGAGDYAIVALLSEALDLARARSGGADQVAA